MKKVKEVFKKICTVAFLISVCICSTVFADYEAAAEESISAGMRMFSLCFGIPGVLTVMDAFSKKGEQSGAGQSQFKQELATGFILLAVCVFINLNGLKLIMNFINGSKS